MQPLLCIDAETCSARSLAAGAERYAAHPSTRVWCVAWAFDGEAEGGVWTPGQPLPARVATALVTGTVLAHNAGFERAIIRHVLAPRHGWPVPRLSSWVDTAEIAASMALPVKLAVLAQVLGCAEQKDLDGAEVMHALSAAQALPNGRWEYPVPTPEQREKLLAYCLQDVHATLDVYRRLPRVSTFEARVQEVDRAIDARGMALDVELADAIGRVADARGAELAQRVLNATGGLFGVTQVGKLKEWLPARGVPVPSVVVRQAGKAPVKKETTDRAALERLLAGPLPDDVRDVLEARLEAGRLTSLAKVRWVPETVGDDGRAHGLLRYCGAHTGRWSSRGLQIHNLPKVPKGFRVREPFLAAVRAGDAALADAWWPVLQGCSYSLRSVIVAGPGQELIGADYSAIEARVVAWLAGEVETLRRFARGEDVYVADAASIGSDNRQLGKIARLGLGYGMGGLKFHATCAKDGVNLSLKEAARVVRAWRAANPAIVAFWKDLEEAAYSAVESPGVTFKVGRLQFVASKSVLRVQLPSGRHLHYWRPKKVTTTRTIEVIGDDGAIEQRDVQLSELRFATGGGKGMEPGSAYGGLFAENITQAVARDVLAAALVRLEGTPYRVVVHVHDSVAAEVDAGTCSVRDFERLLCVPEPWCATLPLAAEGYRSQVFKG